MKLGIEMEIWGHAENKHERTNGSTRKHENKNEASE